MYLGEDPEEIHYWTKNVESLHLNSDQPLPRYLMQKYVEWRRNNVNNILVSYESVIGEAIKVIKNSEHSISVVLANNEIVQGNYLILASGSISVKIPKYLEHLNNHKKVIIDPYIKHDYERILDVPTHAKILVLGTGLTGEEQANILLKTGHTDITLLSRNGKRHFVYPLYQKNQNLIL